MKKVTKEVKSKGVTVDTIEVPVNANIPEAVREYGEEKCLEAINKTVSDAACNAARAAKVRPTSPQAQLSRMAKADPKIQKEIEELLKKYQ